MKRMSLGGILHAWLHRQRLEFIARTKLEASSIYALTTTWLIWG